MSKQNRLCAVAFRARSFSGAALLSCWVDFHKWISVATAALMFNRDESTLRHGARIACIASSNGGEIGARFVFVKSVEPLSRAGLRQFARFEHLFRKSQIAVEKRRFARIFGFFCVNRLVSSFVDPSVADGIVGARFTELGCGAAETNFVAVTSGVQGVDWFAFSNFAHWIASQLMAEAAVRPEVGGVEALLLFETVDIPDFAGNCGEIAVG